ncbi:MAG TPA: flagellar motor stator protein MotA [Burkholderiaceae bacterium]|nr:flagellar motor stator protein MotA [Burkholderiaceae bacterium]
MLVAFGYLVIVLAVFGGYSLGGGHLGPLFQPVELLIIGGAALGAFIVGNDRKAIVATLQALPRAVRGSKYTKELYMEVMALLYVVLAKIRRDGMMSIESDIDNPYESELFNSYPALQAHPGALVFVTDYLRLMVGGNLNPFQIEALMDQEIDTHHHEEEMPARIIAKVGDAMPAFGIVAAVMGVVHTMGSIGLPPAELGQLIAAALVGTFLGILLAYGFVGPLSSLIEQRAEESTKLYQCIKVTLLASMNGYAPAIAVEFGRKVLFSTERPSFAELEDHVRQFKAKA